MAHGGIGSTAPRAHSGATVRRRPGIAGLRERWIGLRNDLLASPRFQRLVTRFPLSRPVARRRAQAAFDLSAGFLYAQVLFALQRLDLLTSLRSGPAPLTELARACNLPEDRLERLISAGAALKLTEWLADGRVCLGPAGAALLANPGALAMIEHHDRLYADLEDPVALLRGTGEQTRLADFWSYASGREDPAAIPEPETRAYSALMTASHEMVAQELLDGYRFHRHRHLLDIGGGEAGFVLRAALRYPHLQCTSFDLPSVSRRACRAVTNAGLTARVTVAEGDFFRDPLPTDADVITLLRVLHDHDDARVLTLLRAIRRAISPDGRLLVAEPMSPVRGKERIPDAYFGMYLMAMGSGRPRSVGEISKLLRQAGFRPYRLRRRGAWMSRCVAAKPDRLFEL